MRLEPIAAAPLAASPWLARVVAPLTAALQQAPALWVAAPAGCGKSVACRALAASRGPALAVHIDAGDAWPALQAALEAGAAAGALPTLLIDGLEGWAAADAMPWLDPLLDWVVSAPPPAAVRLLLLARTAPPPATAHLRLSGRLALVPAGMAHWCWTADEIAAALPDRPAAAQALWQASAGWPVAVWAALPTVRAAAPAPACSPAEVLPAAPPALRQWASALWAPVDDADRLLCWLAARLPALPAPLLDALLPAAPQRARWLARALLWPPRGGAGDWPLNPLAVQAIVAEPAAPAALAAVLQALQDGGHDALAVDLLQTLGDGAAAADLLARLAPAWYRAARHADLRARTRRLPREHVGPSLALWEALAAWYVDPADALGLLRDLARARGLAPGQPPAGDASRLGEDLFVLAALLRSELALLAPPERLEAVAGQIDSRLQLPAAADAPVLCRLGAHSALLFHHSLRGDTADALDGHHHAALALIPQLADRHSLCSTVALARWPLLRGDLFAARETVELVSVGLLAGDDAAMPIAHAWLMEMLGALARPLSRGALADWRRGGTDRALALASPIAPTLLSTLALLEAQAPAGDQAGVQALVLARQERWSPFERWFALAARAWHHARDGDGPAARAVLALLRALPVPPDSLLAVSVDLLGWQVDAAAGAVLDTAALQARAARWQRLAWPGPALLARLLAIAAGAPADAAPLDATWRQHGLVLPLFALPALLRRALPALRCAAPGSAWLAAAGQLLAADGDPPADHRGTAPPRVGLALQGGLAIRIDGRPLAFGRKPPRKLLELVALLALHAPREAPRQRLADALYPELEGDAARRALDTALYRLRRLLPDGVLHSGATGVAFDAGQVRVDVGDDPAALLPEFEQAWAEAARRDPRRRPALQGGDPSPPRR